MNTLAQVFANETKRKPSLRDRLRDYAALKGLTVPQAKAELLDAGLRAHERAVGAGKARAASRTPAEQRAAINARWARLKKDAQAEERQA